MAPGDFFLSEESRSEGKRGDAPLVGGAGER